MSVTPFPNPHITLNLPMNPVTEDQLILRVDNAQYGIVIEEGPDWVLQSITRHEEGRFPTIYDLLKHVQTILGAQT